MTFIQTAFAHDNLVYVAKTFGLVCMMGFFLVVLFLAYRPANRARYERAARSVLPADSVETPQ